ncbi:MAG TPA: hypothetical protein VJ858_00890 [Acidimicrobiia bacterium]|nr:hypothetical protein [Acidimicrobiia bacterium]
MSRTGSRIVAIWVVFLSVPWVVSYVTHPDLMLPFGFAQIMFLVVGAVLAVRVRGNLIGPLLLIGASAGLLYDIGTVYAVISMEQATPLPLEHFAAWIGAWTGPLSYLTVPLLLVLFPDGRFLGWRKWFIPVFALAVGLTMIGALLIWDASTAVLVDLSIAGGIDDYPGYTFVNAAFPLSWLLSVPAGVSLSLRFRGGTRLERQQIKWLLASVVAIPVAWWLGDRLLPGLSETGLILGIPVMALPLAVGVAVLRYRLYDLGRVVSRSVTYAAVIGLLGAAVAAVAALAGAQFEEPWVVAGTTLGVAAVFNPLRRRIQGWVDRRFNRSHYDAERVMDQFAGSLREKVDPGVVVDGWTGVVSETMQPESFAVWIRK